MEPGLHNPHSGVFIRSIADPCVPVHSGARVLLPFMSEGEKEANTSHCHPQKSLLGMTFHVDENAVVSRLPPTPLLGSADMFFVHAFDT